MVSQSGSPPIPMPVQVPPGHVMQQIVDESGTLRHVILSTAQHQQIHGQGGVQGVQPHIHGHYVSRKWLHIYTIVGITYIYKYMHMYKLNENNILSPAENPHIIE